MAHLMAIKRMFGLGGYLHLVWELREAEEKHRNHARHMVWALKMVKREKANVTH